ncbi:putative FAD linked oxidase [Modestobacter italicus]|uniref:FAD linked oxidase n=1 Tax=Modestobacter italicus (strain DSM 44449 / CECT 9708 / BC 501) TaxID=2732864 RepID=I4EU90_MODI5|nr:FAD-binding oxidoreductase [Modestobacter marinus]CCH86953.1 putative FAD linked oxidase [Modestobacter marinus]
MTLDEFTALLGPDRVVPGGPAASAWLRDFSWYSPVLENALADTTVDAVLRPRSVDELRGCVATAAELRVPVTLRGAGTGNYGQSLPLQRGVVVDVRDVAGVLDVASGRISVLPGTVLKDAEEAARLTGQELAIMPSTYRISTAAGFVSGGSGGIGGAAHGDLWDGNVLAVELLTVEERPRTVRLEGDDVRPVLHTYGTIGVLTRVELRLVPARDYTPVVVAFRDLPTLAGFAHDLVAGDVHVRLCSVHEAAGAAMLTPITSLFSPGEDVALVWVDSTRVEDLRELVGAAGGRTVDWAAKPHISQFPFSHTILWARKAEPASSWLQCEYASDRAGFLDQVAALRDRYPGVFLQHVEFATSAGRTRPLGITPLVGLPDHEVALEELIGFCRSLGMTVLNPHSYVVEEGGFVGDTGQVVALKTSCDPYGLLNPGKLGDSFFTSRGLTPPSARAAAARR